MSDDSLDEPIPANVFTQFGTASLGVYYFHSTGISLGDRYSYQIVVIDRTLRLEFDSPGTPSFKRVMFRGGRDLAPTEVRDLAQVIRTARLIQRRHAIPRPRFSGHAPEVLIVRTPELEIAGGMFSSTVGLSSRDRTETPRERAVSSTIGGDFESVINAVRSLAAELKDLVVAAQSGSAG